VFHRNRRRTRVREKVATLRPARDGERPPPWNTPLEAPAGLHEAVDASCRQPRAPVQTPGRWDREDERDNPGDRFGGIPGRRASPSEAGPRRKAQILRDRGPRGRVRRTRDARGQTQGRIGLLRVETREGGNGLFQRSKAPRSRHPWMANDEGAGTRRERVAAGEGNPSKGHASWRTSQTAARSRETPNTMNPRIGCGVQQTRGARDGENRQGGEKPRRRNRTCPRQRQAEARDPNGQPEGTNAGVDVTRVCRWRGGL
jgi:hypothetical protein